MPNDSLKIWKITGIISLLVVVLGLPFYGWRETLLRDSRRQSASDIKAVFVGSRECQGCHKALFDKWNRSHHRFAMATATEKTVLGDFNNTVFEHFGTLSRFYKKGNNFYVNTQGPGGKMGDFQITHTFGWYPLQQYLIPFPGGKMQALPIAWDIPQKRWYHLNPDKPPDPKDWLFWTNQGQNWNGMCAECHSTNLKKNYNLDSGTYHTTWSEISVGCEACHGPGSEHVKWAELPDMGRPTVSNAGLMVQTSELTAQKQIQLCAPCHSRRMSLGDNIHMQADYLDYGIPQLLNEGMYYADGQILEEVYVYGSFMQSKMYARGVRCSDCHDLHSLQRIKKGNDLCLQCHKAALYNTKGHHFHKKPGEKGESIKSTSGDILFEVGSGAQCEQCHMPGRLYMGIDYRPDHGFRIPRPDLTLEIDTPNACNRCHIDKTVKWSLDTMTKWYGRQKKPHFGTILQAGRSQKSEALPELIRLSEDRLYPTIARATALALLASYNDEKGVQTVHRALGDEEALIRYTAVRHLSDPDLKQRLRWLGPLLYDPVKAVRMEAARRLSGSTEAMMPADIRPPFKVALLEFRQAMERTADFPASRHNLGNLYAGRNQHNIAITHYQKAIEIDGEFYPAKVNLAMLYNGQGKKDKAEQLLREVVTDHPDLYEVKYSLGLLLVEKKKYEKAAIHLTDAAAGLPQRARIHYNLGLLLQQLKRNAEAEKALRQALTVEPDNPDFLYALAVFHVQKQQWAKARIIAEDMVLKHPNLPRGQKLLKLIEQQLKP